jgi:hypothetical protein
VIYPFALVGNRGNMDLLGIVFIIARDYVICIKFLPRYTPAYLFKWNCAEIKPVSPDFASQTPLQFT